MAKRGKAKVTLTCSTAGSCAGHLPYTVRAAGADRDGITGDTTATELPAAPR